MVLLYSYYTLLQGGGSTLGMDYACDLACSSRPESPTLCRNGYCTAWLGTHGPHLLIPSSEY